MTDARAGNDPYDAQTRADVARLTRVSGKPNLDLTSSDAAPRSEAKPRAEEEARASA